MFFHPCLYATPDQIETANRNIYRHEWAQRIYHSLKLDADKLREMELPTFETAWWHEVKDKHWREYYPENMQHTFYIPKPAADRAFNSALVYALGGGSIYAERAKKALLHYTSYSFEFVQPDVGMNYAIWGINLLYAYDLIYDRCTPNERDKVDDFFTRMVEDIARTDEWWIEAKIGGRYNNHYAFHKMMMAAYGVFYEKPEWVERAMESDQGIRELIENGLLDDGLWFESSLNYHFVALTGLMSTANMLRNSGHPLDLYTHKFAAGRTLEDAFSGMVQVLFPDGSIPTIGDCYGRTTRLRGSAPYQTAWTVYRKPLYAWMIEGSRPGLTMLFHEYDETGRSNLKPPAVKSKVFPQHGYVMLRSAEGGKYWDSDSWAAFLSFAANRVHAHADKLNLILFGSGKVLACDPEALASARHAFSSQVQGELNRTTICHNTLMVDSKMHQGVSENLTLVDFRRSSKVKSATIADFKGLVYLGVKLQRTVEVTDDYVLDVFQAVSEQERSFEWLFHTYDDEGMTRVGDSDAWGKPTSEIPWDQLPWSWLRNVRSRQIGDTWQADWRQGEVLFRLTMLGHPATEVILCDFPRNDQFEPPAIPMLIARRIGKSVVYIAVYQAEEGELPPVEISSSMAGDELKLRVSCGGKSTVHTMPVLRAEQ